MGTAYYRNLVFSPLILVPATIICLLTSAIMLATSREGLLFGAFSTVMAIGVTLGVIAYAALRTAPRTYARRFTTGTPIAVDTGPRWLGIALLDAYTGMVPEPTSTRSIDGIRVMSDGDHTLIPEEIIAAPASVARRPGFHRCPGRRST